MHAYFSVQRFQPLLSHDRTGMSNSEIASMARAYGEAVRLAREAGMDAVEIHAGHGYLISQFLYPVYQPPERRIWRKP